MWPFSSKKGVAADPVGVICRLLIERWWEWHVRPLNGNSNHHMLEHISGVGVEWDSIANTYGHYVWLRGAGSVRLSYRDADRVVAALTAHAAARAAGPPRDFGKTANALATRSRPGSRTPPG